MLQIGKSLEPEEFAARVVPALSKLFTSSDRSIRRSLLENIDFYGPHLDRVKFSLLLFPRNMPFDIGHVHLLIIVTGGELSISSMADGCCDDMDILMNSV